MSAGRDKRPNGMTAMNFARFLARFFARFSGVSGTPVVFSSGAVSPITREMQFARIFQGVGSTSGSGSPTSLSLTA